MKKSKSSKPEPDESKKSTWKTLYLIALSLTILVTITYLGAVIWFSPLLDATYPLFTTAETWKWVFPLISLPLAFFVFYLVRSLSKDSEGDVIMKFIQISGLFYGAGLIVIIIFNIIEWVNHCTSSSSSPYAYCYDGTGLTDQYQLVFWLLIVHFVLFSTMMFLSWYAVRKGYFKLTGSFVSGKYVSSAYAPMTAFKVDL